MHKPQIPPSPGRVKQDLICRKEQLFARRNVGLKGEEENHGCVLQSTKQAFTLFRAVMQVLILLVITHNHIL